MTARIRNQSSVRFSKIASAIAICAGLIVPVAAQEPARRPIIPRPPMPANAMATKLSRLEAAGIHVFRAGPSRTPERRALFSIRGAYGPGITFQGALNQNGGATSSAFTLTPRQPFAANQGGLDTSNEPSFNTTANMVYLSPNPVDNFVTLNVDIVAGRAYLIDVAVAAPSPGATCRFVVSAPGGQKNTYPCSPGGATQHLVFGYAADASGLVRFAVALANPQGPDGALYSATVSAL